MKLIRRKAKLFAGAVALGVAMPVFGNPCAAKNPCTAKSPCAAKTATKKGSPCHPCNPCAAKNPCAPKKNPCAGRRY